MSQWYRALAASIEENLLPLSALLRQRGIEHRIVEQDGRQVLELSSEEHLDAVRTLYRDWREGRVDITLARRTSSPQTRGSQAFWRRAPVTLLLVGLSVCGFLLVYLIGDLRLVSLLTFSPFEIQGGRPVFGDMGDQYWRLVTPIFLHFSWLHIVFNCLWLWEFGRHVEGVMGRFNMLMLCLVIALVSNVSQFVYGGQGIFGGMSGVVYGLLGFAWVAPLLQPRWPIQPQPMLILFMVGWLLACLVGLIEALGFGAIANAAHVGGLLSGAALGTIFGLRSRLADDSAGAGRL